MARRGRTKTTADIANTATRLFLCIGHVLAHIRGEFLGRSAPWRATRYAAFCNARLLARFARYAAFCIARLLARFARYAAFL